MTVRRVYLIRHGQTDWNVEGRWQGFEPVPLNEVGLAQAKALADYWKAPLDAIYTSDLQRALQTASPLAAALGLSPRTDERLREFNLGLFQGLTYQQISERYPAETVAMRADYMGFQIPNGESRYQLQARAYAAWLDIMAQQPGQEIAIVSHGGTLKVLLLKLLGDTEEVRAMHIHNTSITTLERYGDEWQLVESNATPHLAALAADGDQH